MIEPEEILTGGNIAAEVVRVGTTVRKPATKSTPAVHSFLKHLSLAGYTGSPQAFGVDEKGRQILEFIPGQVVHKAGNNIPTDLYRVGRLVRAFHDAAASFQPPTDAVWDPLSRPGAEDILCHNDLAPWNLIIGADRWVFIDWDNAAPGTRLWDLAWTAISFPPVRLDGDFAGTGRAIREIADGYGLHSGAYRALIDTMAQRAQAASDHLLNGVLNNDPVALRLHAEKHDEYWGPVAAYLRTHAAELEASVVQIPGRKP